MNARQLAILVLRLMGVYTLIEAVPLIIVNFSSVAQMGEPVDSSHSNTALIAYLVLPPIFRGCVGIFLLFRTQFLAEKLMPQGTTDVTITVVSFEQVQAFTFAIVGLLVFLAVLPQLIKSAFSFVQSLSSVYRVNRLREGVALAAAVLKTVVGLALFFRARWFVNYWRSMQAFETPKPPQSEQ